MANFFVLMRACNIGACYNDNLLYKLIFNCTIHVPDFLLHSALKGLFSMAKFQKVPTVGGGPAPLPHPPLARSLRSLAKCPPHFSEPVDALDFATIYFLI